MTTKIREKIGLIGVGNMGAAILEGLLKKELAAPSQIWVFDKMNQKVDEFAAAWKVNRAISAADLAMCAPLILLAVKPQDLGEVAAELKTCLKAKHSVISILAGTPLTQLQTLLGVSVRLVRAMPNLGAKVGEAITALTGADPKTLELAEQIFSGCGKTFRLAEDHFNLVTAISGSGPAYFFYLMELLIEECLRGGLSSDEARSLAVQTAVGAALLAQASSTSPGELRKMVTSKGGTTEAALKVLEAGHFPEVFQKAIQAAIDRSRELAQR